MAVSIPKSNYVVVATAKKPDADSSDGFESVFPSKTEDLPGILHDMSPSLDDNTTGDIRGQWKIAAVVVLGGFFCDLDAQKTISNPTGTTPGGLIDIAKSPNGLVYKLTLQNQDRQTMDIFYFDGPVDLVNSRITNRSTLQFRDKPHRRANLSLYAGVENRQTGPFFWRRRTNHAGRSVRSVKCYTRDDFHIS